MPRKFADKIREVRSPDFRLPLKELSRNGNLVLTDLFRKDFVEQHFRAQPSGLLIARCITDLRIVVQELSNCTLKQMISSILSLLYFMLF